MKRSQGKRIPVYEPIISDAETGRSLLFRALVGLALVNAVWFIWSNRFIPMSDYPDWLYQGFLFSKILRGKAAAHFSLKHYPVPYATLVTIAIGLAGQLLSPEAAGKLVLTVTEVLFVLGSLSMLRSLGGSERNPFLIVPLALALNSYFYLGEISFLLGISLFFLYCGYLFRRIEVFDAIPSGALVAWSFALFFSHLLAYLFAILVTGLIALQGIHRARILRLAILIAPTAAMTIWYALARIQTHSLGAGPLWIWWTPHLIAGRFLAAFSPFPEVLPWLGIQVPVMSVAAVLNAVVSGFIVIVWIMCAIAWIAGRRARPEILAAAVVCVAGFVGTGFAFAGMVSPGERFLLPAAWLGMCWLGPQWRGAEFPMLRRALTGLLAALLIAQIGFTDIYVRGASEKLEGVYRELATAKSHTEFCAIYTGYVAREGVVGHRRGLDRFLTGPAAVLRLPYYLYIVRDQPAPIFTIGIFDYDGSGNNENLCL